jgi:hypothetical protein
MKAIGIGINVSEVNNILSKKMWPCEATYQMLH